MINKSIIVGNLGQDPEAGETQGGTRYCRLSVATSERWRDRSGERKEKTTWHDVVIWGNDLANACAQRLKKGSRVYVEGKLDKRKWTDKAGVERWTEEIVVQGFGSQVIFLDRSEGIGRPDVEEPESYRERSMMEA